MLDVITPHVKNTEHEVTSMAKGIVGQVGTMLEEVGGGLRVCVEDATVALVDKAEQIMDMVEDRTKLIKEDIKIVKATP